MTQQKNLEFEQMWNITNPFALQKGKKMSNYTAVNTCLKMGDSDQQIWVLNFIIIL